MNANLRHTVPPAQISAPVGPEYGCVGLCIGGTCLTCDAIADQIGEARLIPTGQRDAREAELTQQINALREGTR